MSPKIPSLLPGGRSLFALFACSVSASAEIVINEIHYNGEPNNVPNEFIELHNTGADPVDISGWFFNDGVDFTFPPGSVISAGGYAVVAEDPATLLALAGVDAFGPYAGALSGKGEAIELRRADGTRADTVDYRDGFPWPIASDGEGASMELINPALDNDLGGSWRSSSVPGVLPEITLLPASASGWRWRGGATEASAPIDAWRQPGFVEDGSWSTKAMPIGFGAVGPSADRLDFDPEIGDMRGNYTTVFLRNEFQIAPGEVPPTLQLRFRFDDGFAVWINGTEVHRENVAAGAITIASIAEGSTPSEELWYDTTVSGAPAYLVEGTNTIAIQLLNSSAGSSDCGMDFELIRPAVGVGAPPQPTPGARNSTFAANAPPAIRQVDHTPSTPAADEAVLITAKVSDPDGVAAVTLEFQDVAPGAYVPAFIAKTTSRLLADPNGPRDPNPDYHDPINWTSVAMVDDGTGGDAVAGDDVYTALLTGRPNRTLVRYRITVEDALGAAVRVPYPDDSSLNFAYFVYDGVPDYHAETRSVLGAPQVYPASVITSVPVYHLITDSSDFDQAVAYNSADRIDRNQYDARSAYNWSGTFVYDGKVYDNIGYRLRQRNARYAGTGKRSFKFRFNLGNYPTFRDMEGNKYPTEWKSLSSHKMRSSRSAHYTWGLYQSANHILWNMTGTPAPYTHWFNMRVIRGAEEAPAGANGQYLGDHYGLLLAMEEFDSRFLDAHGLEKGNLYKLISGRTEGTDIRRYLAPTGVDDGSDYENIIFNCRPERSDDWLHTHVNFDHWNWYHLVVDAVRHYDVAPNLNEHLKNRAFYFKPVPGNELGQLHTLPWDSDTSWGPNWNGGEDFPKQAIHGYGGNSPRPEFIKEYKNVAREFRDLIWTEEQIALLLDPLAAQIAQVVPADRDRWIGGVGGSDSLPAIEGVVADMKRFAFIGGSWVGGEGPREAISKDSGISGQQGRDAYLDALAADPDIPDKPTITYSGDPGFPQDGLAFASSPFADPGGVGSFGGMEWRVADITPPPTGGGTFSVLDEGAQWTYLDDGSDQGTAWRVPGFNDDTWKAGSTPAGYGAVSALTFATMIEFGPDSTNKYITTYFRTTVDIVDPTQIDYLTIRMLVDDGAVIYVNGQEVHREGLDPGQVSFDTLANENGNETVFDETEIPPTAFVAGENVIAVEVHQRSQSSSDMGFEMSMTATELINGGEVQDVRFEWDAEWESGELATFAPEVVPPGTATRVGDTYRARVRHKDNTGRWSHWSDPVEFTVSEPSIQPWLDGLVVSEIMYHPAPPTAAELAADPTLGSGDFEWIEIANVGPVPLDLSEIRFTKGVDFDFLTGGQPTIASGQRLVVVANEAAFNLRYGHAVTPPFVVGEFDRNLANGGEQVKLSFGAGTAIRDFEYDDRLPWPEAADGLGPSLTLLAPASLPDHSLPGSWRASADAGGSPGADDTTAFLGDPLGDDNGDGVANLIDYAAGGAPSASIVTIDGVPYPALTFDANPAAEDVIVTVEVGDSLETWSSAPADVVLHGVDYSSPGRHPTTYRSAAPAIGEAPGQFLRLRVEMR